MGTVKSITFMNLIIMASFIVNSSFAAETFQAGEPDEIAWQVLLVNNGDFTDTTVYNGAISEFSENYSFAHADVSISVSDFENVSTSWSINVTPKNGYGVYEVQFPILKLTKYGEHDQLLLPKGEGIALSDPFNLENKTMGSAPRIQRDAIAHGIYPSNSQSMQFVIHDSGNGSSSSGMMIWAKDPAGFVKEFTVSRISDNQLRAWISHFPENTGQPDTGWDSPYEVITTSYENKSYEHVVLNEYRPWVVNQKWTNGGTVLSQIQNGTLPNWYENNAVWMTAMGFAVADTDRVNLFRSLMLENGIDNVNIGVLTTQWMKYDFDRNYPDYFPPKAIGPYLTLVELQNREENPARIFPYMNSLIVDTDEPSNESLILEGEMAGPPQGNLDIWENRLNSGAEFSQSEYEFVFNNRTFSPMSPADSLWQATVRNIVHTNFQQYGTDGHYLDQLNRNSVAPSFNTDDGHLPGFGDWFTDHLRSHVSNVKYPSWHSNSKALMGEGLSEITVDLVHDNFTASVNHQKHNLIPLFSQVYGEYTSLSAWNLFPRDVNDMQSFVSSLSLAVHLGHKVGTFPTVSTWDALLKSDNEYYSEGSTAFLVDTVKLLMMHPKTILFGRHHLQPTVELQDNTMEVTWYENKAGTESHHHTVPKVRASLFKNGDGAEKVILLSNSTNEVQSPIVKTSQILSGTTLYAHSGGQFVYDKTVGIEIPPYSWLALSTVPYEDDSSVLNALEPGHWYRIPNSDLRSIMNQAGEANLEKSMSFTSGVWDDQNNQLVIWPGGGDQSTASADYSGNAVYAFSLESLTWSQLSQDTPYWNQELQVENKVEPSSVSPNPDCHNQQNYYQDCQPRSRKTSGRLIFHSPTQSMCSIGAKHRFLSDGVSSIVDCFNIDTQDWRTEHDSSVSTNLAAATYVPSQDSTYGISYASGNLYRFDHQANTWTNYGKNWDTYAHDQNMVLDPAREILVSLRKKDDADSLLVWNIGNAAWNGINPLKTGYIETQNSNGQTSGLGKGFVYVPEYEKFAAWTGGENIQWLDIENLSWQQEIPLSSNTVAVPASPQYGVFGRFQWAPSQGVFVLVTGIDEDVLVYRPKLN